MISHSWLVGYGWPMRLHITLDDETVAALDRRVGPRRRSAFVTAAVVHALADEQRWDDLAASIGALGEAAHGWDSDPAAWVRAQRAEPRRAG